MRRSASTGVTGSGLAGSGSRGGFGCADRARAASAQQGGEVPGEASAGQAGRAPDPAFAEARTRRSSVTPAAPAESASQEALNSIRSDSTIGLASSVSVRAAWHNEPPRTFSPATAHLAARNSAPAGDRIAAMAKRLPAPVRDHLESLGFIQPTGLVVSAHALVQAGAILNRAQRVLLPTRTTTDRLRERHFPHGGWRCLRRTRLRGDS